MEKDIEFGSDDENALEVFKKYIAPLWNRLDEKQKELALNFLKDPVKIFKKFLLRGKTRRLIDFRLRMRGGKDPVWRRIFLMVLEEYARRRGWTYVESIDNMERFIWEKPVNLEYRIEEGKILPRYPEEAKKFLEWLKELKEKEAVRFLKIKTYQHERMWTFRDTLWINTELASRILGVKLPNGIELRPEDVEKIVNYLLFELEKSVKDSTRKPFIFL